jgi:hypothetical protein
VAEHRAVSQRAPVVARAVAAVQVRPASLEAQRGSREVRRVKQAEQLARLQEPREEAERLRIAPAAVPMHRAEPMVARAVRVAMALYPRR